MLEIYLYRDTLKMALQHSWLIFLLQSKINFGLYSVPHTNRSASDAKCEIA